MAQSHFSHQQLKTIASNGRGARLSLILVNDLDTCLFPPQFVRALDQVRWARGAADVLATLFFFIIVVSLFPLGIGPERETLRTIAPGVVWVAALLASMLSLDSQSAFEAVKRAFRIGFHSPAGVRTQALPKRARRGSSG